jgi:uncharacterized membrane protein YeaQ/YmgE (transglycosylase-associated protein family)
MGIILWILFGAIVGWVASIIMRTDEEQGALANIIIGIVGAFLGGTLSNWLGGPTVSGFNLTSVLVSILGAMLLIFFIRAISGRSSSVPHN